MEAEAIHLDLLDAETVRQIESAANGIQAAWEDVALAGPEPVANCAGEI